MREQLRTLITNTMEDWYSDSSRKWDLNEYLEMEAKSDLIKDFGEYLFFEKEEIAQNPELFLHVMTQESMPVFDLGDWPSTFNPNKVESEQLFIIPKSDYTSKLVIEYSDCKPTYNLQMLHEKYLKTSFENRGITFEDFQASVSKASVYQIPYRGRVTKLDRNGGLVILGGLVVTIAVSMSIGLTTHWALCFIFIALFFLFTYIVLKVVKSFQNKYLR